MKTILAAAMLALAAPLAIAEVVVTYAPDGTRTATHPIKIDRIETQADAERAFLAISRTAKRTCAHHGVSIRVFEQHKAARQCTTEAIRDAIEALGNPRVTALYESGR